VTFVFVFQLLAMNIYNMITTLLLLLLHSNKVLINEKINIIENINVKIIRMNGHYGEVTQCCLAACPEIRPELSFSFPLFFSLSRLNVLIAVIQANNNI
jgi:hypothetical protein